MHNFQLCFNVARQIGLDLSVEEKGMPRNRNTLTAMNTMSASLLVYMCDVLHSLILGHVLTSYFLDNIYIYIYSFADL